MVFIGNHSLPWRGRPSDIARSHCLLMNHPSRATNLDCPRRGDNRESPSRLHASRLSAEPRKPLGSKSGGKEAHDGHEPETDARGSLKVHAPVRCNSEIFAA